LRDEYQDITAPITEHRCLSCHATGANSLSSQFATSFSKEEGVGCEACHGPGSAYATPEVMRDRERFIALGGPPPDQDTCRRCHGDAGFVYGEYLAKISHALPEHPSGSSHR